MGYAVNTYTLLYQLTKKENDYSGFNPQSVLQPFNLFAIILHDPDEHQEFSKKLYSAFEQLDYHTGSKLLFFALCNPPNEWKKYAKEREYYKFFDNYETRELINPENTVTTEDSTASAYAFARALKVPIESLPCIIVTHDLKSKEFLLIPTSEDVLIDQLKDLGFYAERKLDNNDKDVLKKIKESNIFKQDVSSIKLTNALLEALFSSYSFIIASKNKNSDEYQIAKINIIDSVKDLKKEIDKIKKIINKNNEAQYVHYEKLDELTINLASALSVMSPQSTPKPFIDLNLLETESRYILRTAIKISSILRRNPNNIFGENINEIDYTPGIICFSKVYERETNLSIIQWIRSKLGIEMPDYYNQYKKNFTPKYPPSFYIDGKPVDFNSKRKGLWSPPGIGQSEIVFNNIYREFASKFKWDDETCNILLRCWNVIRQERNKAAHTLLMSKTSLIETTEAIKTLNDKGIFQKYAEIKKKLKGN
jgi:hypothetical protein